MKAFHKTVLSVAAMCLLPGVAALAQTEGGDPGRRPRGEGPGREGRRQQRDPVEGLRQLREAMGDELQLTDQQFDAIDELFESHVKQVEDLRAEDEQRRAQNEEEVRDLRRQMREASENDDREKARELGMRVQELTAPSPAIREANDKFSGDVKAKLTDEQRPKFDALFNRFVNPQRGRGGAIMAIFGALRQIDLNDQQDAKIREIREKHMSAFRQAQSEGPEAAEAIVKQLRDEIMAELTAEQKAQFEQAEEQIKNNPAAFGRGGPDGPRRERRGGDDN